MSLLLALFLIAVILIRIAEEKSKSAAYDIERQKEKWAIEAWESLYVDKVLERKLTKAIKDERNHNAVCDEVLPVLTELGQYRLYNKSRFNLKLTKYQNIALDIMLAHRGKVSSWSSYFGYHACMSNNNLRQKEHDFEYAETILKLLEIHKQHPTLLYKKEAPDGKYIWEGSFAHHKGSSLYDEYLPFDRSVLFKENPTPPIH